ncbi:MAG: flagellar basal body-associated FliL family protein [Alphaproteobacteria bacterium]|nr:flagellar basal body-associated FliL family protein [Alphaproteobacteria bacterium]
MAKSDNKNATPPEEDDASAGGETITPEPAKKRLSGKFITLYIALPLLLLLFGGGVGAYFLGVFGSSGEEHAESADGEHGEEKQKAVFYDLPEILVNLNSSGKKETYLKIRIALEIDNPKVQTDLAPLMPRIVDNFQVFLREMRVEDLSGSAGMVRLKEELLQRINLSVQPIKVRDVLFKEMLIQ